MASRIRISRDDQRLAMALLLSLGLHAAATVALKAGRGPGTPATGGTSLTAHLILAEHRSEATTEAAAAIPRVKSPVEQTRGERQVEAAARVEGENHVESRPAATGALPFDFIRAGTYYLASRVERSPTPLSPINFQYPENTSIKDGVVRVRVLINARGGVDDAIVESSDPAGVFETVTINALTETKFYPGLLLGHPVAVQLQMEVTYRDPSGGGAPGIIQVERGPPQNR